MDNDKYGPIMSYKFLSRISVLAMKLFILDNANLA